MAIPASIYRIRSTLVSRELMARSCSRRHLASPPRLARHATPAAPSRQPCSWQWAFPASEHSGRFASALAALPPRRRLTRLPKHSLPRGGHLWNVAPRVPIGPAPSRAISLASLAADYSLYWQKLAEGGATLSVSVSLRPRGARE